MDGIVMGAHTEHAPDYWTSIHRPVIAFDRTLGEGIPSIGSDHVQGGRMIADLLIRTGARHVAVIGGPHAQFKEDDDVRTTFPTVRYHLVLEHELAKVGVRYEYIEAGEVMDFSGYAAAVRSVFDRASDDAVDAVVSSDIGAALCVREAIRRGVNVPDDMQIVAYDGTYLADMAGMPLTVVRQDFQALASSVADCMMRLIDGKAGDGSVDDGNDSGDAVSAVSSHGAFGIGEAEHLIPVSLIAGATTRE